LNFITNEEEYKGAKGKVICWSVGKLCFHARV